MTREQYAQKALRNGMTRARKHLLAGNVVQAVRTIEAATATAVRWLSGTHPQQAKAVA